MESLSFSEILKAVNGKSILENGKNIYNKVSTDTRKIKKNDIFIALKGEKYDANEYIEEASKKGAGLCIVDKIKFKKENLQGCTSIILVNNTKEALVNLAKYYRSKLRVRVIGITGSTGKTSTKDLTQAALSDKYKVFKTKNNFNNNIGLPLMILELDNTYDFAVLEMGMSHFGEIHEMVDAARPEIALITNIGISHIENLKTRENILKAKMEITDFFANNCKLIINADNDLLSKLNSDKYTVIKTGIDTKSDYTATDIKLSEREIEFYFNCKSDEKFKFNVDVLGKHNVYNSLLAIACAREIGLDFESISRGLKNMQKTSMRLEIEKGKHCIIVNDSYNASPDSMKAAVDVLSSINHGRKIAVLGTMKELGEESYEAHKEVGEYLKDKKIDYLFVISEFKDAYRTGFANDHFYKEFKNKNEILGFLKGFINEGDVVLVKASRTEKFEEIAMELKNNF